MKIPEFCQALEKALADQADSDGRMRLVASAMQQAFKVKETEVAIFRLDQEHQDLCFVWPKRLTKAGHVPLSARESLVARTSREGRAHLDNRFPNTRHASIFERVNAADPKSKESTPALPIQKIMSAPLLLDDRVVGAIQLSRRGLDADAAGPDFTATELEAFAYIAKSVTPFLHA